MASHHLGWTELPPLHPLPARHQVLSGGACEQKTLLLRRFLGLGHGEWGLSRKGTRAPCPEVIVPIFVIIKLGLELLSAGELGLGMPCTPALEASVHFSEPACLQKGAAAGRYWGPSFPLVTCWFHTQPEANRRVMPPGPRPAHPSVL